MENENTNNQLGEFVGKIRNPFLGLLMVFLMQGGFQYFEPVIDHWLQRDKEQEETMREYVDGRFTR